MPYWVLKRLYSKKAGDAYGKPYVWNPLTAPFRKMAILPTTKFGFKVFANQILVRYGKGIYRILRTNFYNESPGYKPVCIFRVDDDTEFEILKRYTSVRSHDGPTQAWFKIHEKREIIPRNFTEWEKFLEEKYKYTIIEKIEKLTPRPSGLRIEGKTWVTHVPSPYSRVLRRGRFYGFS